MPAPLDLQGERRQQLIVIGEAGRDTHGNRLWKARCRCNTEFVARGTKILSGHVKSCGCLRGRKKVTA